MISSEQTVEFVNYMVRKYNMSVVQKATSKEMKAIAWALDMMGIKDKKEFMERYTTTIGNTVYVNFDIGKGNQSQLISQIKTFVHEAQHMEQLRRNPARYTIGYLTSSTKRSHYETDAYRTNQEMHYFFYGRTIRLSSFIDTLRGYNIGEGDLHVAKKHLKVSTKLIKQGLIISGVSKDAIKWFKKNGVKGHDVAFS